MHHDDERSVASGPAAVIELRQYEMQPGRRDDLIELFERELIRGQEDVGMRILGQFHDDADPDSYVWIRGFAGMDARRDALDAFYTGAVWAQHREAANATMIDVSNVLLLRPCGAGFGDIAPAALRAERPTGDVPPSSVIVVTVTPAGRVEHGDAASAAAGTVIGAFETEPTENTYPRLPVRTGADVRVVFRRFTSATAAQPFVASLAGSEYLLLHSTAQSGSEHLLLHPTARSFVR
jgi:hypothetical protein